MSGADLELQYPDMQLDEGDCSVILRQVLKGLEVLHRQGIPHYSLKLESILIGEEIKLTHVSLCDNHTSRPSRYMSAPFWQAPEAIGLINDVDPCMADIWSLGILAIQLSTRKTPREELACMRFMFQCVRLPPPQLEGNFSQDFKDFVSRCLQLNASDRMDVQELLLHPFISSHENVCFDTTPIFQFLFEKKELEEYSSESDL